MYFNLFSSDLSNHINFVFCSVLTIELFTVSFVAGRRLGQLHNPTHTVDSPNTPVHIEPWPSFECSHTVTHYRRTPLAFRRLFSDASNI